MAAAVVSGLGATRGEAAADDAAVEGVDDARVMAACVRSASTAAAVSAVSAAAVRRGVGGAADTRYAEHAARHAMSDAQLARLAVESLIEEAELTPKPALVDGRGSGAHRDLDLPTMRRSARALEPTFEALARASRQRAPSATLRAELAQIGRAGEQAMMRATDGSNAHRGAIWITGLLVAGAAISGAGRRSAGVDGGVGVGGDTVSARGPGLASASAFAVASSSMAASVACARAAGMAAAPSGSAVSATASTASIESAPPASAVISAIDHQAFSNAARVCSLGAQIACFPDRFAPPADSNGERVRQRYQVGGARREAQDGFPHALNVGLPALVQARERGIGERAARVDALLAIMASLDDTCLLHRAGLAGLQAGQQGARRVLAAGGSSTAAGRAAFAALDRALVALNASPGGAADLLAATLFLDKLSRHDFTGSTASWNI
jgi:triphosphoribosyl-dephospho-CoA synthase